MPASEPWWVADLDQFGKEYPAELYGTMEIEELEDLTDEAIMGTYLGRPSYSN